MFFFGLSLFILLSFDCFFQYYCYHLIIIIIDIIIIIWIFLGITDEDYVEEEGSPSQLQQQLQLPLPPSLPRPDVELEVEVEVEVDEIMSDTDSMEGGYISDNGKVYKSQKHAYGKYENGIDGILDDDSPTKEVEEMIENYPNNNIQDNKVVGREGSRGKNVSRNQIIITSARKALEEGGESIEVEDEIEADPEGEVENERLTAINSSSINQITSRMSRFALLSCLSLSISLSLSPFLSFSCRVCTGTCTLLC